MNQPIQHLLQRKNQITKVCVTYMDVDMLIRRTHQPVYRILDEIDKRIV